MGCLTVGKYPSVKTLNRLVLPQAPSPMMTSFLQKKTKKRTSVEKLFVDGELTGGCVGGVGRAIALPLRTV